jgi:hypothetical protein
MSFTKTTTTHGQFFLHRGCGNLDWKARGQADCREESAVGVAAVHGRVQKALGGGCGGGAGFADRNVIINVALAAGVDRV